MGQCNALLPRAVLTLLHTLDLPRGCCLWIAFMPGCPFLHALGKRCTSGTLPSEHEHVLYASHAASLTFSSCSKQQRSWVPSVTMSGVMIWARRPPPPHSSFLQPSLSPAHRCTETDAPMPPPRVTRPQGGIRPRLCTPTPAESPVGARQASRCWREPRWAGAPALTGARRCARPTTFAGSGRRGTGCRTSPPRATTPRWTPCAAAWG